VTFDWYDGGLGFKKEARMEHAHPATCSRTSAMSKFSDALVFVSLSFWQDFYFKFVLFCLFRAGCPETEHERDKHCTQVTVMAQPTAVPAAEGPCATTLYSESR